MSNFTRFISNTFYCSYYCVYFVTSKLENDKFASVLLLLRNS